MSTVTIKRESDVDRAFVEAVREAVSQLGEGDTRVLDVEIADYQDVEGDWCWDVRLILPRPSGITWDLDKTYALTSLARRLVDEIATGQSMRREGLTIVDVTTRDHRAGAGRRPVVMTEDQGIPRTHFHVDEDA